MFTNLSLRVAARSAQVIRRCSNINAAHFSNRAHYPGFQYQSPLPTALSAGVEPLYSPESLQEHYGHHLEIVKKFNHTMNSLPLDRMDFGELQELAKLPLDRLVQRTAADRQHAMFFNMAGEMYNHEFFWKCITSNGNGSPSPQLEEAFDVHFGGIENFKEKFNELAMSCFGSGWVYLFDDGGHLELLRMHDADCPIAFGPSITPILALDVWEHSYYGDYQNNRKAYVDNFWKVVNWEFCNEQLNSTM